MRGRLWFMWFGITLGGFLCIALGYQRNLGAAIICLLLFSCCVQASEGAVFGVVPSINPGAMGVVSGIVGAGGNVFSALLQIIFFRGAYETNDGIVLMGVTIVCLGMTAFFIYFPEHGGMLCKPGALGSFDPQLVKVEGGGDQGVDTS